MITTSQAARLAEDLVAQERLRRAEGLNANARKVPLLFNVAEIQQLQPFQRAALINTAQRVVDRNPFYVAASLAFILAVGAVWYFTPTDTSVSRALWVAIAGALAISFLRVRLTRRSLRRLAIEQSQQTQASKSAVCPAGGTSR